MYRNTIMIRKSVVYHIGCCHCNNKIDVESFKDKALKDWKIHSNTFPIKEDTINDIECPECYQKRYDKLYNGSFEERLQTRYYDEKGHKFYDDLLEELGLVGHPKVQDFINLVSEYDECWNNKYVYAKSLLSIMK